MKSSLLITFLFLTIGAFAQTNADSIIKKNRIKEVRIVDKENGIASVLKYDQLGRLLFNSMDNFTSSTFLKTALTKIYDDQGNNIKTISTHSSFAEPTIWTHEYDQNKNRISVKDQKGDFVFKFFYDDSNFLIKELLFEEGNIVSQTTTYEKADGGRKIISKIIGDFIKNRVNTTYLDENGNTIKTESDDGDKINFSSISTYNKNRLMKILYHSGYGSYYNYDSVGRLIKRQHFRNDNGVEIKTDFEEFKYNNNGLIKRYKESIYSRGNIREYVYHYDYY